MKARPFGTADLAEQFDHPLNLPMLRQVGVGAGVGGDDTREAALRFLSEPATAD